MCKTNVTAVVRGIIMELVTPCCIHGYHVYREIWMAILGEQLICERGIGDATHQYAIAVKNDSDVITKKNL